MPKWSIITVAYNSRNEISHFWSSLAHEKSIEWILIDNASADDSVDLAESLGALTVRLATNLGFGAANNIGFERSSGEYVIFVNPDVSIDIDCLTALGEHLDEHPMDLVSPQLVNSDGSLQPNGRGEPYLVRKIVNRLAPKRGVGTYLRYAADGQMAECSWLMGAVVAGRRERFAELGPWDPHFFVYYEDSDLGLRNLRSGGRNVVLGGCRWTHGWARETSKLSVSAWKLEVQSMLKFYARYPLLLSVPGKDRAA
ncbi:glycosyltransferase family 2 protein [Leucobacter sp. W1038]|uniref:glycosyltransferase family 2 protein n=1 Tax=Leucobacter sp. W1038 TaxID=3438281 RepID=UPI003D969D37